MKKIVIATPHSHSWFWTQVHVASLKKFPPKADGFEVEIVVVDNSWDWSPSIKGISETPLGDGITIHNNTKPNKFHASALDDVVDHFEFDYLMAMETDAVALHPDWLQWFVGLIEDGGRYAVGHWHHEQFINPSCTIYRGDVLRRMRDWCKANTSDEMRWGDSFEKVMRLHPGDIDWVAGPFAEKRGWPEGTQLAQRPSGQSKGFGWYEPGQALHHWATQEGHPYMACQTATTSTVEGVPVHTIYGKDQTSASRAPLELENLWMSGYAAHLWGGTRALDIIKHDVSDGFVLANTDFWLSREARFWLHAVPEDVRQQTIGLINEHGWHTRSCGAGELRERDKSSEKFVNAIYRRAGIPLVDRW